MANSKGIFIVVAVVVAAGFGYYALKGKMPPRSTEGTIGAASRYQANQIGDQDVKLSDPAIQTFLQSDMFHHIQTNPEFAKLVTSEQFRSAMQSDAFKSLMADGATAKAATSTEFAHVITQDAARSVLADGDWGRLATQKSF